MDRDLYLPIPLVEALGRATIARSQLELCLNVIVSTLAREPGRLRTSHHSEPFETKVHYLSTAARSRLLRHEWWLTLRRITSDARRLNQQYLDAAMGCIYSRGAGYLEAKIRPLAAKANVAPPPIALTPAKIDRIAEDFRRITRAACDLATSLTEFAADPDNP